MSTKENQSDGKISEEAESLITELNEIFKIYTAELKDWRQGKGKGKFLMDEDMFDVVVKLLNVSDKIRKLNTPVGEETTAQVSGKVVNIQDVFLTQKKS